MNCQYSKDRDNLKFSAGPQDGQEAGGLKDKQKELGLLLLEKIGLWGDLQSSPQYPQGCHHEDAARIFTVVHGWEDK